MVTARGIILFVLIGALGAGVGGCPAPEFPEEPPPADDVIAADDDTTAPITPPPVVAGISVTAPGGSTGAAPQAYDVHVATFLQTPVTIELSGAAASEGLVFAVVAPPEDGDVSAPVVSDPRHAKVVFTPTEGFIGTAQFSYVARSEGGTSNIATVLVEVVTPVQFEVAAGTDSSGLTATAVAFTVSNGGFPPGELCWNFGETQECGSVQSHAARSHIFSAAGAYAISLVLLLPDVPTPLVCQTADGRPSVTFVAGAASAANQPPVANAGPDQLVVDLNGDGTETVTLNGGGSQDADGTAVNYRWTEGDTVHFTGSSPTTTVSLGVGIHLITLQVTDDQGATASDTVVVIVGTAGTLRVTPETGLAATGALSGPFAPESKSFTLQNTGVDPITWAAACSQGWMDLSSPTGTLVPGATTSVTVSIGAAATTLAAGSHAAQITFQNVSNGRGNTTRTVNLTITAPPAELEVTPSANFATSGVQGGPFTPSEVIYTLANRGTQTLSWRVSKTQSWLNLSKTTGTLLPGQTTTVTAALDGSTTALAPGTYSDTLVFSNLTTGAGNTTRTATLTVSAPPGVLTVGPEAGLTSAGVAGGPFTPTSLVYTLTNTGGQTIAWGVQKSAAWLQLSAGSGVLSAGASASVAVTVGGTAGTLPAGTYNDVLQFNNTTNGVGNTTRPATLSIVAAGGLLVSPGTTLSASGPVGGPFAQTLTYTLSNTGGGTINWSASKAQSWIGLSTPASGSLASGATATVTVAINSDANALAAGNYSGAVSFTNTTNGVGNATRSVGLSVLAPGTLAVAPTSNYATSGNAGGTTWTPASKTYTLTNAGAQSLSWSVTKTATWLQLSSPTAGTLAPGASINVSVWPSSSASSLAAGAHTDTLTFANSTNGNGNATRTVTLTAVAPGLLSVTPGTGWSATGAPGGPFNPTSTTYTLTNTGGQALNWTAAADQTWLSLSSGSGTLAAGGTATVTASLNAGANSLSAATHNATIAFVNSTSGAGDTSRSVTLTVTTGPQMASSISQYGITWTFDKPYRVGQFVTGDWWVIPDDPNGTVVVQSVNPAPTGSGTTYRNGSMVNPAPGAATGFDGRLDSFNQALATYYPCALAANKSLVSMESAEDATNLYDVTGYRITSSASAYCTNAAVLTCLAAAPGAQAFRPPYCGSSKPIYDASVVNIAALPSLAKLGSAPSAATVLAYVQRPWIDTKGGSWGGRMLHPIYNMPNYGREVSGAIGSAAAAMITDYTVEEKRPIAYGLIQIGIDNYWIVANGGVFREGGAHAPGRKFPVLFAGYMLGNALGDVETDYPGRFNDTGQIFYITQAEVDRTLRNEVSGTVQAADANSITLNLVSGYFSQTYFMSGNDIIVDGQRRTIAAYNTTTNVATVSVPFDPVPTANVSTFQGVGYESGDIGIAEWSQYHYSVPDYDNPSLSDPYRAVASQGYPAQALASLALGITASWAHPAFFDWVDRYMDPAYGGEQYLWRTWHRDLWNAYRADYSRASHPR